MKAGYDKGAKMARIVVPLVMAALLLVVSSPSIQCASYQTDPNNPCALSKAEPDLADLMKQVKNFASANNTALANMIGYLYFHDKGYLPLVLSKFDVDQEKALLASECATLTWKYWTNNDVHLSELDLEVPTQDVITSEDSSKHTCRLNYYTYNFPPYDRFTCKTKMSGGCRPEKGESLVNVVMGSLELELMGDPAKISKGEFSSVQPASMSCYLFSKLYA